VWVPEDGAEEVPTNAPVWLRGPLDGPMRIETLDGEEIEAELLPLWTQRETPYGRLQPVEPLDPETTYRVVVWDGVVESTFTTGSAPDTEPPPAPLLLEGWGYNRSPESGAVSVTVLHEGFLAVVSTLAQLEHADDRLVTPEFEFIGVVSQEEEFEASFAKMTCDSERLDPRFQAVAIDLAGNISEPSEVLRQPIPPPGCGGRPGELTCLGPNGLPAGMAFLVLVPWASRRRRR